MASDPAAPIASWTQPDHRRPAAAVTRGRKGTDGFPETYSVSRPNDNRTGVRFHLPSLTIDGGLGSPLLTDWSEVEDKGCRAEALGLWF